MEAVDVGTQVRAHWSILKRAGIAENHEYDSLYTPFDNTDLRFILSTLHHEITYLFRYMNTKLPVKNYNNHYRADESRRLLACTETIYSLRGAIKGSGQEFEIDNYYNDVLEKCRGFLSDSYGSDIPDDMERIELYYSKPIFVLASSFVIEGAAGRFAYPLKDCGSGSYARVYRYKDDFYDKWFILKKARDGLTDKEIARFRREFDTMKQLSSPYIVEVYRYTESPHQYTMEYMDDTVWDYIHANNNRLSIATRLSIAHQVLRAFRYVHGKKILHRDISPKNVLIKHYEDVLVVKLSDFGLVKLPDSTLTSLDSDTKGFLNDPNLRVIGFDHYSMCHEIYALTLLVYFIMTGRTNYSDISQPQLKEFVHSGITPIESQRYPSVGELEDAFSKLSWS